MNVARRTPTMTRAAFFGWAQAQRTRFEFDGFAPVAMTGGSNAHSQIAQNVFFALRSRLQGACRVLGPDAGIATVGDAVRYPDAVVTCGKVPGHEHLVPDPVVVFEVLSPSSGRIDRIDKLREYREVVSIRRYVILEFGDIGATVFAREGGAADWTATALAAGDVLAIPETGIEVPLSELYADLEWPASE